MARNRHKGLGRGLDALIPQAAPRREKTKRELPDPAAGAQGAPGKEDTQAAESPVSGSVKRNVLPLQGGTPEKETVGGSFAEAAEATEATEPNANEVSAEAAAASENSFEEISAAKTAAIVTGETAAGGTVEKKEETADVRMLRLSQVDPNRSQPRRNFQEEALEELAESIRQFGVLQPILVQKKGGRYEIIAGERRWRASRKAGLKEIPAIVREYSSQETLELSLIENIQREDLNPIEEAQAFKRLLDEFGLRQEDLAARVSKSRTAITNAVRLLKLDERVQEMLVQEQISMGHARALLPIEIPDEQVLIAQEIAEKHLSVRDVEKLIKTRLSGKKAKGAGKKDRTSEKDPALELAYRSIEERLKQSLGTKAVIHSGTNGTGKIEIDFYSSDDLEKIVDLLT